MNDTLESQIDALTARMTLVQKASQLVNDCAAIPELGLQSYNWLNEALHGVASAGLATVFPQAIGLAGSFDESLLGTIGTAIGREARIKHRIARQEGRAGAAFTGLNFYSPNINIFRDPRWGRGQETFGEDPLLTARLGVAFIKGLQGDDPDHLLAGATAKHFAVHSGPERGRHSFNAEVSTHDLEDTYLPAFRAAVVEGGVAAVMAAYNRINGIPACAHPLLQRLQSDWNFTGQIVSDCDAVRLMSESHHSFATNAQAYAAALKSGVTSVLDFFHGNDPAWILDAVAQGWLTDSDIDRALRKNLRLRLRLEGSREEPAPELLDSQEHRLLALTAARRSLVLLKNDGTLPLPPASVRIALIGPLADSERVLLGSYHGTPSAVTTVLRGMQSVFGDSGITHEPGTSFLRDPTPVPAALFSTPVGDPGILVEFFAGPSCDGPILLTRTDGKLEYNSLSPGGVPANRAVRWQGFLTPVESGDYELGISGNSARLYFNGALLIDESGPHAPRATLAKVSLIAGRRYPLVIELFPGLEQLLQLVWIPLGRGDLQRAVRAAEAADVVVAVVGITAELENEEIKTDVAGFSGGDRTSLELPAPEEELLRAVHATGKPLVVVLMSGGPLTTTWASRNAAALLQCWYPGEEGGRAVAETLAGIHNPSGRLPVTLYRGIEQLPPFEDYSMARRTYRYFPGSPLYPFGHGLSYSRFGYHGLQIADIAAGEPLLLSLLVTNQSAREGAEVVQVYLQFPPSLAGAPRHALCDFRRIEIGAGETQRLEFKVAPRQLSHVDLQGVRRIAAGEYGLFAGGGQPDCAPGVGGKFQINGQLELPR